MRFLYVEMGLRIVYGSKDAGCHRSYADYSLHTHMHIYIVGSKMCKTILNI